MTLMLLRSLFSILFLYDAVHSRESDPRYPKAGIKIGCLSQTKLSDTRWSARHDGTWPLAKGPVPIKESLCELAEDEEQIVQTRHDVELIPDKLNPLEYEFMGLFSYALLGRIQAKQQIRNSVMREGQLKEKRQRTSVTRAVELAGEKAF